MSASLSVLNAEIELSGSGHVERSAIVNTVQKQHQYYFDNFNFLISKMSESLQGSQLIAQMPKMQARSICDLNHQTKNLEHIKQNPS